MQFAYELLSDPKRRARYDATGDENAGEEPPGSLAEMLARAMGSCPLPPPSFSALHAAPSCTNASL